MSERETISDISEEVLKAILTELFDDESPEDRWREFLKLSDSPITEFRWNEDIASDSLRQKIGCKILYSWYWITKPLWLLFNWMFDLL